MINWYHIPIPINPFAERSSPGLKLISVRKVISSKITSVNGQSYLQMTRLVLIIQWAFLCVWPIFWMALTHRSAIHFHITCMTIGHTIHILIRTALLATTASFAAVTAPILAEIDGRTWAEERRGHDGSNHHKGMTFAYTGASRSMNMVTYCNLH